jgi:dsRNA-specific ribonuclease
MTQLLLRLSLEPHEGSMKTLRCRLKSNEKLNIAARYLELVAEVHHECST